MHSITELHVDTNRYSTCRISKVSHFSLALFPMQTQYAQLTLKYWRMGRLHSVAYNSLTCYSSITIIIPILPDLDLWIRSGRNECAVVKRWQCSCYATWGVLYPTHTMVMYLKQHPLKLFLVGFQWGSLDHKHETKHVENAPLSQCIFWRECLLKGGKWVWA